MDKTTKFNSLHAICFVIPQAFLKDGILIITFPNRIKPTRIMKYRFMVY